MSQLIQLFRQNTGSSPYAYVIAQRVARARRLLETTDLPIARVAIDAGFADQAHLTRMLRRHLGVTPRNIRLQRFG
jgi:AraC family transcriptional regulator